MSLPSSGVEGSLTVSTSAVLAKVGSTNLDGRSSLTVSNVSANTVYWGYRDSVTTSSGTPIAASDFMAWEEISSDIDIYLIASSSSEVRITEA
jgi:hypothetical protein